MFRRDLRIVAGQFAGTGAANCGGPFGDGDAFAVVWSANAWASTNTLDATPVSALNLWFADLSTQDCPPGSVIEFTFRWKESQRWEDRNHSVTII